MKKLLFTLTLPLTLPLYAATLPTHCDPSQFQFQHNGSVRLRLGNGRSWKMYAITSTAKEKVWMTHERKERDASAGWDSIILPNQWSAILITQHDFALMCHLQSKTGVITDVPCSQVLVGCQYHRFTTPEPMHTGYWVVESVPFDKLKSGIKARGFAVSTD